MAFVDISLWDKKIKNKENFMDAVSSSFDFISFLISLVFFVEKYLHLF